MFTENLPRRFLQLAAALFFMCLLTTVLILTPSYAQTSAACSVMNGSKLFIPAGNPAVTSLIFPPGAFSGGENISYVDLDGTTSSGDVMTIYFNNQLPGTAISDPPSWVIPGPGRWAFAWTNNSPNNEFLLFSCSPSGGLAPIVTSVSPSVARVDTSVTITGVDFTGVTAVNFGTHAAIFTVASSTSIIATAPASFGTVDVTVTTPTGTSGINSGDQFTYVSNPTTNSLTSSLNPSRLRGAVTLTATVAAIPPTTGTPTGTVTFKDSYITGTTTLGTAPLDGSGRATFTSAALAISLHQVTSVYGGDVNFMTSTGSLDQVVLSPTNTHDLNGDGISDIVWRDGSGNTSLWLMNGAVVASSAGLGTVPIMWSIVGQRDFNGDGKTDLLWRDTSGNTAIWFMSGTQVSSTAYVGNIPSTWSVIATGDFNGDGKGDILWRDGSGNVAVWLMNGGAVSSSAGLGNVPVQTWAVVGTGDYNGDGMTDLLWRDTSGNIAMWFMNGTQIASSAGLGNIPTSWSVVGSGDFNGDGIGDIVWRNSNGDTSIWLMNGAAIFSAAGLGNVPTQTWSIVQTGDYNGNGTSDLMWRDTNGNAVIWFMNGTTVASTGGVGNIPTIWTVQSAGAE
jgi:hypothetical protein